MQNTTGNCPSADCPEQRESIPCIMRRPPFTGSPFVGSQSATVAGSEQAPRRVALRAPLMRTSRFSRKAPILAYRKRIARRDSALPGRWARTRGSSCRTEAVSDPRSGSALADAIRGAARSNPRKECAACARQQLRPRSARFDFSFSARVSTEASRPVRRRDRSRKRAWMARRGNADKLPACAPLLPLTRACGIGRLLFRYPVPSGKACG